MTEVIEIPHELRRALNKPDKPEVEITSGLYDYFYSVQLPVDAGDNFFEFAQGFEETIHFRKETFEGTTRYCAKLSGRPNPFAKQPTAFPGVFHGSKDHR